MLVSVILLLTVALKNFFAWFAGQLGVQLQEYVTRDLRDAVFRHLQRLPIGYFQKTKTGQIMSTVLADTEQTRGVGDAERNRLFAEAYGRDPDFFAFYRSMSAYETGLRSNDTRFLLRPDSEFFRFFGDAPEQDNGVIGAHAVMREHERALVADALSAALATAGRTISARTADIGGVAGPPESVEVGVDRVELAGPELSIPDRRAAEAT